jgi:hypothetical protein
VGVEACATLQEMVAVVLRAYVEEERLTGGADKECTSLQEAVAVVQSTLSLLQVDVEEEHLAAASTARKAMAMKAHDVAAPTREG